MAQSGAGVVGGEVPVDLALIGVGGVPPGGEFGVEDVEVADAAVQALAGQRGELDPGDVEPGPVFATGPDPAFRAVTAWGTSADRRGLGRVA